MAQNKYVNGKNKIAVNQNKKHKVETIKSALIVYIYVVAYLE